MSSLAKSRPVQVRIESQRGAIVHDVTIGAPTDGVFDVHEDVKESLRRDGIALARVTCPLRAWALKQVDVERVVLRHSARRYAICILLTRLFIDRLQEIHLDLTEHRRRFGEPAALINVFGPHQRESALLNSAGQYTIYHGDPAPGTSCASGV